MHDNANRDPNVYVPLRKTRKMVTKLPKKGWGSRVEKRDDRA